MGINPTYIKGYTDSITSIINGILVPTLIAVAFATFLWGIYTYFIKGAADPKAQESGRTFTLYGIIGFAIIFSVWGIVQIFMGTLGIGAANAPRPPTLSGSYGPGSSVTGNTGSPSLFPGANTGVGTYQGGYPGGYPGGNTGAPSGGAPTQTQITQQLTDTYNEYQRCLNTGGLASTCDAYLASYKQEVAAAGGTATCGVVFKSVCAPGSTCSFGFCQEPTLGDTGGSLPDGSSCTADTRAMCLNGYCTGGKCSSTAGAAQGACFSDTDCVAQGRQCINISYSDAGVSEGGICSGGANLCDDTTACNYGQTGPCNMDCYNNTNTNTGGTTVDCSTTQDESGACLYGVDPESTDTTICNKNPDPGCY